MQDKLYRKDAMFIDNEYTILAIGYKV